MCITKFITVMKENKDEVYYAALDLLRRQIALPSASGEEAAVADMWEDRLRKDGYNVFRTGNNVWAEAGEYDAEKPTLLLNSHIDTVRPVDGWRHNPYEPVEEECCLYGLGVNDAGAALVSLWAAFRLLADTQQPYNLIFLASCEEEICGSGGIESVLPLLPPIDFAVVGEPTGMQPAIAERGLMVLDCTVYGKAENVSGNAIYKALPVIEAFKEFRFENLSVALGEVKMAVTCIQAGEQHNVIPDRCRFTVDIRTNDCYANEDVLAVLKEAMPCEIVPRSMRLNSSGIDASHPFVRRAELLGCEPFGSSILSDQALMRFPSVKMGPGDSSGSHIADENVRLDEIREAIEMYLNLLDDLQIPRFNG